MEHNNEALVQMIFLCKVVIFRFQRSSLFLFRGRKGLLTFGGCKSYLIFPYTQLTGARIAGPKNYYSGSMNGIFPYVYRKK